MPDPVPPLTCWDKVEDKVAVIVAAVSALSDWTVLTGHSADVAVEAGDWPAILVWTTSATMDQSEEHNQSIHEQIIELEFVSGGGTAGTLNRANKLAMARAHAAIAADRTLGGMLLDIQEIDIAPARIEGKDVNGLSLQYKTEFYTARGDWLIIHGQGGAQF